MILSANSENQLFSCLEKVGFKNAINRNGSVLIKINLAHPAEQGHPRTDSKLLLQIIHYIYSNKGN
jgi:hypothetical protein